jgi:hypothetical protein
MEDPHVVESLTKVTGYIRSYVSLLHLFSVLSFLKMKEEQDKLEKRLWEEREGIRRSHEEKVKVAKTKYATYLFFSPAVLTLLQGKLDWSWPVETRDTGNRSCATNVVSVLSSALSPNVL